MMTRAAMNTFTLPSSAAPGSCRLIFFRDEHLQELLEEVVVVAAAAAAVVVRDG